MNPYADLPRVDDLLDDAGVLVSRFGRALVRDAVRDALDDARRRIGDGQPAPTAAVLLEDAARSLEDTMAVGPRPVINAAGVVVHTNLGRAPLSDAAVRAMTAAAGWCDLEVDLDSGSRGSRGAHVDHLLARAVGAADAMVVNNCASALVLALMALAPGRDVLVSRGHLVEIGGSFRLPDIMAASGARLVEVGTTNRTRADDYDPARQVRPDDVAALLTVHPSNFVQEGFVAQPSVAEVAAVARGAGLPLVHDAGSGLLDDGAHPALADEPSLAAAMRDGAGLVLASGDKLLGGPQVGLIAGDAELVQRCRRHPLARALRVDKLRLAALSATLVAWLRGDRGTVVAALRQDPGALRDRVAQLAAQLADLAPDGEVVEDTTMIGGGSAPGVGVRSPVLRLPLGTERSGRVAAQLRASQPTPVVVRVADGAVLVDCRTVPPASDEVLLAALREALGG